MRLVVPTLTNKGVAVLFAKEHTINLYETDDLSAIGIAPRYSDDLY